MRNETVLRHLKAAAISAVIGIMVSSFFGVAIWPQEGFQGMFNTMAIGAVIGVVIYASIRSIQGASVWLAARAGLSERSKSFVHFIASIAGAFVGALFGLVLGARLLGGDMSIGDVLVGRGRAYLVMSAAVAVLASVAFRAFEALKNSLRSAVEQLKEREWAEKELEMARSIQRRLLPPEEIEGDRFAISARNLPARMVAGDFYDVVKLEDGSVAIIVADVAGKGMGASLIMASVKAVLPFLAHRPVSEAMSMLNEKLVHELEKRDFVALAYARYFPAQHMLHLANAGFPDPYIVRNGTVQTVGVDGPRLPLGVRKDIRYETSQTTLRGGDRVLFVSDGLPEAPTVDDQPLGYERLARLVQESSSVDQLLDRVRQEVRPVLEDDWTALALTVR